ncbi:alpha/beta hydrolase [Dactylosporangium sp. CS-047395]|uniref:alpha/beta hydrolase n=1 Tax=Dactylosporangium sp. CS-047395 TaxID=3239936 RepID=UPI003D8D67E9
MTVGGAGPPILLLHGFPQTHLAWRFVAAELVSRATVVCPDLRGYGASRVRAGAGFSKRVLARDAVDVMGDLGFDRFTVVGHDRGALVGFRLAMDHPGVVVRLAVVGAVPSVDRWATVGGFAGDDWHHLFLAQPGEVAERMVAAAPEVFFGNVLGADADTAGVMPAPVRQAYLLTASSPEVIRAICGDFRASATVDRAHDEDDRQAGRRLAAPTLAVWADTWSFPDPAGVWSGWADDLRTVVLPGARWLPEVRPVELSRAVLDLMGLPASV